MFINQHKREALQINPSSANNITNNPLQKVSKSRATFWLILQKVLKSLKRLQQLNFWNRYSKTGTIPCERKKETLLI